MKLFLFELTKLCARQRFYFMAAAANAVIILFFTGFLASFAYVSEQFSSDDRIGMYEILFKMAAIAGTVFTGYFIQLYFLMAAGTVFADEREKRTLHSMMLIPVSRIKIFAAKSAAVIAGFVVIFICGYCVFLGSIGLSFFMFDIKDVGVSFLYPIAVGKIVLFHLPTFFLLCCCAAGAKKYSTHIARGAFLLIFLHAAYWTYSMISGLSWFKDHFFADIFSVLSEYFYFFPASAAGQIAEVTEYFNGFGGSIPGVLTAVYTVLFGGAALLIFIRTDCE